MNDNGFYLAACSPERTGGVYRFRIGEKGIPEQLSFAPLENVSWMSFSPDRKTLYTSCTVGEDGGVAAFRVKEDNSLEFLNKLPAKGLSTCYVTADPEGKFLYCANYRNGNVGEFSLNPDGSLQAMTQLIQHTGHGPNAARQESAHTHYTRFTPDGKYLAVVDLGIDAIKCYPFRPGKGIDGAHPKVFAAEPGSGPRHIVFTRSGKRAYVINELGNSVVAADYADGTFTPFQTVTTLPPNVTYSTKAAAVRLSEDERFLFASNRGFDSIAVYSVDPATGRLTLADMLLSGGVSPRDIEFLPGRKLFAACNEFSDETILYDFNAATGRLTPNGQKILKTPRPLAILW